MYGSKETAERRNTANESAHNANRADGSTERTPLLRREPGLKASEDAEKTTVSTWRQVVGICLALVGVFLVGADQSFLMVTYEVIASRFHDISASTWVLTGYNLGYCVALPVYSKLSDSYGRQIPLAASYCLFSIGCLISGVGVHLWQVIAGRIITGLGGAGMIALISVIITDNVPPSQVALARSYVNTVNVSGRALGGPLGAFIAGAIGWRWSFLVQVPTALLCGVFCMALLSTSQLPSDEHSHQAQNPLPSNKIDFLGIACFTVTTTSLLASIELWGKGSSMPAFVLFMVALSFGVIFLLVEAYHAQQPLIPLSLLKTTSAIYFAVQMLLLFGRQAHVSSLSPYFLWTKDITATKAAVHLIPSPIGFTAGSIIAGMIIRKSNRYKVLCIISLVFGSLVYLLITFRWAANRQLPWEWLYSLPAGVSLGAALACTFTGLTISTEPSLQATAICVYYLSQQLGGIIGTAVSTVVLHSTFKSTLGGYLRNVPNKEKVIGDVLSKSGLLGIPEPLRDAVRMSYLQSFQYVSIIPVVSTALALPLVLGIPKVTLM